MNALLNNPTLHNLALLAGRALLSALYIISGYGKIVGYAGTQAYMEKAGVPGALLPLVILTELGGGLAILVGWQMRLVAVLLAGFTVLTALMFHNDWSQQSQQINFLKNLSITGGFLAMFAAGAGQYSVDGRKVD